MCFVVSQGQMHQTAFPGSLKWHNRFHYNRTYGFAWPRHSWLELLCFNAVCGGEEGELDDIIFFSVSAQSGEFSHLLLLEPGELKPNSKAEVMLQSIFFVGKA